MIYISTTDYLKVRCGSTQAMTMTTGPNDASRVIWALGEFRYLFLLFLYTYYYIQVLPILQYTEGFFEATEGCLEQ